MNSISSNQSVWICREELWKPSTILSLSYRCNNIKDNDLKFFCQRVVEVVVQSIKNNGLLMFTCKGKVYLCDSSDTNYRVDNIYLRKKLEDVAIVMGLDRFRAKSLYFSDKLLRQFIYGTEVLKLRDRFDNPDYDRLVSDLENEYLRL